MVERKERITSSLQTQAPSLTNVRLGRERDGRNPAMAGRSSAEVVIDADVLSCPLPVTDV